MKIMTTKYYNNKSTIMSKLSTVIGDDFNEKTMIRIPDWTKKRKSAIRLFKIKIAALIFILGMALCLAVSFFHNDYTDVETVNNKNVAYMSICVKANDTLWDIASEYYSGEFGSIKGYVKEIKRCNSMESDTIYAGRYIIVPVYANPS